jgi:hypothetical protein
MIVDFGFLIWKRKKSPFRQTKNQQSEFINRQSEEFDLTGDLGENRNIANDKPEIVARMSKEFDAWAASVNRSKTGADYRK